jgi:hypothetical protein
MELFHTPEGRSCGRFAYVSHQLLPVLAKMNGAVYGSWAMVLHGSPVHRIPHDLDLEIVVPGRSYETAVAMLHEHVDLLRHEPVTFAQSETSMPIVGRALVAARRADGIIATVLVGFKLVDRALYPRVGVQCAIPGKQFEIPALALETCIAQKVVRLSLPRASGKRHTRWQDAMDLYDVFSDYQFVNARAHPLAEALRYEWIMRGNGETLQLLPAPAEWLDFWDSACFLDGIKRPSPFEAVKVVNSALGSISSAF